MEFGKFLFLYLLGRNVDYFVYKRILDNVIDENDDEDEKDGEPRAYPDEKAGNRMRRALARSDTRDAAENELYDALPIYTKEAVGGGKAAEAGLAAVADRGAGGPSAPFRNGGARPKGGTAVQETDFGGKQK